MEEYKKNFLDVTEIDRIQQEIERDLYGAPQSVNVSNMRGAAPPEYHAAASNRVKRYGAARRYNTKKFRRGAIIAAIICTLGTGALGVGIGAGYPYVRNVFSARASDENSGKYINAFIQDNSSGAPQAGLTADDKPVTVNSMSDVIKLVTPSVVLIDSLSSAPATGYFSLPSQSEGLGSGVIFSMDAEKIYIVTNYHVITGAGSVTVNIDDSDDIRASFVGSNPDADLAVISAAKTDIEKVGVKSVSIAVFGDSDKMQVGDPVAAIGNAMGEGKIVTSGIISANNKKITVDNKTLTVIQTDAPINPGNSGGPLINKYGEIIGINTAKLSDPDVEGMGYSITANVAAPILNEILQQKPKPFLGVSGEDLSSDAADFYNLPGAGVLVDDVVPGSGAQKAGIQRADVITGFDGETILNMEQLIAAVQKRKVGEEVIVKVYRNGKGQMEFKVKLTEYKTDNF